MADNVTVDNGTLTDYAVVTDEITSPYTGGTAHAQGVKILSGTANATDVIPGNATNGLLVDVSRVQGTVTVGDGAGSLTVDGTVSVGNTVTVESELTTADLDTGAGTDTRAVVGIVKAASGGGVLISDANPLPISDAAGSLTVDGPLTDAELRATAVPVSGTVSVSEPVSVDDNGGSLTVDGSVSISGTAAVDQANTADIDYDTGAGSVSQSVVGLALPGSGGPVAGGTSTNPVRTDPTGSTTQPVSGTVAVSGTVSVDSELPAAAAVADNTANPTVPGVASFPHVFDGSTWDRAPGTSADGLLVNLGANNDVTVTGSVTANAGTNLNTSSLALEAGGNLAAVAASLSVLDDWDETDRAKVNPIVGQAGVAAGSGVAGATTQRVTVATDDVVTVDNGGTFAVQVDGAALTALQLIDDTILTDDAAFTPATSKVSMAGFEADETATDSVDEGDAGAARMTLDRKVIVTNQPHAAGGCSIFRSLDLDETEEDVKTSAGTLYGWYIANTATSTRFVKFYNDTAANVVVGTTTPVMTLAIPGNSSDDVGANVLGGVGIAFGTAICVAATTGVADADTGAPGANEVIVNLFYK